MALQTGGPISFNDIQIELGRASGSSNVNLYDAEAGNYVTLKPCQPYNLTRTSPNGAIPNEIYEWYGYNQSYNVSSCNSQTLARSAVSALQACTDFATNVNKATYYLSGSCYPLAQNCVIYSEQCCNTSTGADYYSDGTNAFFYDGGITGAPTSCVTTTTTTTTTTAAPTCFCDNNTCSSGCSPYDGCFCNVDSDCIGQCL